MTGAPIAGAVAAAAHHQDRASGAEFDCHPLRMVGRGKGIQHVQIFVRGVSRKAQAGPTMLRPLRETGRTSCSNTVRKPRSNSAVVSVAQVMPLRMARVFGGAPPGQ
ncbi:hypothetical protein LCL97_01160 [Seohaeicola saemankumensis]|nr:hypothetical protein [Seohaeicola saemankumensis]MCA0869420.1 hypothetical protein [Seohaeicola saemankumensis]